MRMDGKTSAPKLGGYGIQTAPAMSTVCAANVLGTDLPNSPHMEAVDRDELAPLRLVRG
jgi:hypothetical protein